MTSTPNVVIIVADDLGYSDLGCYGGEIRTPVLDRLGRAGVRMTQFYTTPRCAPSRAALLTGRHPHEVGLGDLTSDDRPWGYPGTLDPRVPTLAERLRDAGYATSLSGKWHLSGSVTEPDASWPTRRGFDDFYGIINGSSNFYSVPTLMRGEEPCDDDADPDFYLTDAIADHAVEAIERNSAQGRPFLSYVAFTAPHFPLHAPDDAVEDYADVYDAGWDDLRAARHARMVDEGIVPAHTALSPRTSDRPAWDDVPDKQWQARRMQVYAAQVTRMDQAIGRIVQSLQTTGALENTLLLFFSDNGGCAEGAPPPVHGPSATRDGRTIRVGNTPQITPGPEDTYASYGPDWANLSNTPFRMFKRWTHEGGISTPFIVHWPAADMQGGAVVDVPHHVIDVLPTVLDAVGTGGADTCLGRSMLQTWTGAGDDSEVPMCWEHVGNAAIREGRWKLVRSEGEPWELYDIAADRTETTDRAHLHPEIVSRLAASWASWAERTGVIPFESIAEDYHRQGRYLGDGVSPV